MEKRSFVLSGHATSVALEPDFWVALEAIAAHNDSSLSALIAQVDSERQSTNLASALRCFALQQARNGIVPPSPSD